MSDPRRCPQCDAEIPVNSPAGLCPRCLLKASADSKSGVAEPGPTKLTPPASGFVPPTVEELAPLFPQLEILELLGKGGMGAVYKARQPGLDRLVALKILPPEISHDPAFAERFQREARALARLSHPHIVAVYDFGQTFVVPPLGGLKRAPSGATNTPPEGGTTNGLCYIVMEFVDGTNLRQTIRTGRLAAAEALAIVPQICEALQFAHDEGIVHRDIKPENILIDKRGRVKIADFGLAKLMANGERESPGESLTATHQVMGTLRYMAPEQMQGSREVDHRADIYSLGVVFYELLTGELPMGRFAPPSKKVQVDVRLDEVVLRALEQDPEQRYQHASDVKSDVDTINRTPSVARPESAKGVATPSQPATADQMAAAMAEEMERRKRLAAVPYIVGLGCILLAIGGVAVALFISENGDNPTQLVEWLLGSPFTFIFLFAGTFMLFMAWARYLRERKPSTGNTGTGSVSLHRQQDAKEILPLVMGGLYVMSIVGWALAIYGGARVISESAAAGSDRRDGLPFGCILVVSIVAQVVLHKAWKQGRDRLARIGALDLVTAGGLMSLVIPRWCGLPSWAGLIYSLVAFVGYLMLRGKDISAGLRDRANQSKMPQTDSSEPRLSRCALIGAIWAPLFFIAFLMTFVGSASYAPGEHTGPAWWQLALMFTLLPLGALAPFGTTILGAVAIAKIKRSDGKLYGLRLAQADALLFPLLLLAGVAGFVAMLIVLTAIQWGIDPRLFDKNDLPHLLIVVMAVPIWFFPARALWRAVVGPRDAFELGKLPVVGNELLTGQAALVIALAAITAHAWPWHWISSPPPSSRSMTISNFDVIDALQSLGLLVLSIGGALFASAATLARPAKLILRIGSVIAALVALVIQVQFFRSLGEYEPGHVEKVVRLTRTYSHMGVYVTIALTGLAILFFVLRFIEGMMAVAAPLVPLASGRPAESPTGDVRTHTPVEMSAQIPKQRTEPAAQQSLPYLLGWLVWWLLRERWFVTILQTATALVYFVCLIAFFSFQSSSTLTVAGSHTKFQVGRPTAWLTLESSQAGQNVRFEFITLTHFVALIGLASLVIYRWLEHRQSRKSHSMMWHYVIWIIFLAASVGSGLFTQAYRVNLPRNPTITASQSDLPPLGTITSGIGVEFIVPAGQVVTFEIVTRRDNETVPIPSHCAYLMAADKPVGGQFRWSPKAEENTAGRHRSWRIEIRTAGGGGGFSEATLLPDELNAVVGARGLTLGLLEPNEESIHWGTADVNNLPANGLIGLRVTVVAHGMKQQGSGTAHIDWKKAQPTQSTTRRKLPDVAP